MVGRLLSLEVLLLFGVWPLTRSRWRFMIACASNPKFRSRFHKLGYVLKHSSALVDHVDVDLCVLFGEKNDGKYAIPESTNLIRACVDNNGIFRRST